MNLRSDLSKQEKASLIKDCKKVLDEFDPNDDNI